jgi:hypothetical protein
MLALILFIDRCSEKETLEGFEPSDIHLEILQKSLCAAVEVLHSVSCGAVY